MLLLLGAVCASLAGYGAESNQAPTAGGAQTSPAAAITTAVPVFGRVTRAQCTSEVTNLEPFDSLTARNNGQTHVAYFTENAHMAGQTVIHRWEYNAKVMAEIPFKVGAGRWRVYSTKTLDPSWIGEWKAPVADSAGSRLSVNTFTCTNAADTRSTPTGATAPAPVQ